MKNSKDTGGAMDRSAQNTEFEALKARVEHLEFQIRERTTLRDQLAMAVMVGLASNTEMMTSIHETNIDQPADRMLAIAAYEQADEMLKVRNDG